MIGDTDGQVQGLVFPEPTHAPFQHQSVSTFGLASHFNRPQSTLVLMTGETDCGSHNFSGQVRPNADIEVEARATRLRGDDVWSMQLPMATNVESGLWSPNVALLSSLPDLRHGASFQFCCYEPQIPEKQKKQPEQSTTSAARLEDGVRSSDVQLAPSGPVDTSKAVSAIAQEVMGTVIDANAPLMSAGLDSLSAVDFVSTLATKLGLEIAPTALFDHPTINSLASFLSSELASTTAKTQTECQEGGREVESIIQLRDTTRERMVNITAWNFSVAGGITTPSELRSLSMRALAVNTDVPLARWAVPTPGAGPSSAYGSFMSTDQLSFDHGAFGISLAEARSMDPQQNLVLSVGYGALCQGASFS